MPERGTKTSIVPVVWATFGTFFCRRDANDFVLGLVTMDETMLYHYDPQTNQQSMEWRHNGSPRPKYSECKNSVENFSPRFFEMKTASSWWIIFQRAKVSSQLCWCNWRTFWRKNVAGISPRLPHFCTKSPFSPGTFNPEETVLPGHQISWSSILISGSGPVGLQPVTCTEKRLEWSPFSVRRGSHCCRETWLVGQTSDFFWVTC